MGGAWPGRRPPARIETDRLQLRRFERDDAEAFGALLERNRDHYGAFIAFYLEGDPAERVVRYRADFDAGEGFSYAAFLAGRLIGGGALLPRVGPGALEIGYHVGRDDLGRGYATEIAGALVRAAFDVCGAERIELHIAPENRASVAVAARLGIPLERRASDVGVYTLRPQLRE